MIPPKFSQDAFAFLQGLSANNDKAWFDDHRGTYKTELEAPFAETLEIITEHLLDAPIPLAGSKRTMFRMHRDIRFSKDKRPYKTQISGLLTPDGTKSKAGPLAYLQLDVAGGMMAAGFYQFTAKQLAPIREHMVEAPDAFSDVLDRLNAAGLALDRQNALTRMPRGFEDCDDHIHAEYIKLKSLTVQIPLTKSVWKRGQAVDRAADFARNAMPLLGFGRIQA